MGGCPVIELLDDMEQALTDLMQSGFSTGGPTAAKRLHNLSLACEELGLHTGGTLLLQLEQTLNARSHAMEKDDLPLASAVCRTVRYIQLCREKLQEEQIIQRWQSIKLEEAF